MKKKDMRIQKGRRRDGQKRTDGLKLSAILLSAVTRCAHNAQIAEDWSEFKSHRVIAAKLYYLATYFSPISFIINKTSLLSVHNVLPLRLFQTSD